MYKERYEKLVNAACKDEDPDFIRESITLAMRSFCDYVDVVYNMETRIKIAATRYEGSDYRDFVMNLDRGRRIAHEHAIGQISMLNRICDMLEVERLFDGDTNDRYEVADFCITIVNELFDKRQK